jgi:tRNA-Thr(GGU) m(6)t(6)A37 methyltransferase TsaA
VINMSQDKIAKLQKEIESLKQRWPAHSVPPSMMERLDALEEELAQEVDKRDQAGRQEKTGTFQFKPIGYVKNQFQEPTDAGTLTSRPSRIVLAPDLKDGLIGLEPGMQILVVFVFHRAVGFDLLQHPRGDPSREKRGVFALHSPNRPNPIGVTQVELLAIEGNILTVRGLDAIDGTPVLDLKLIRKPGENDDQTNA